MAATLNTEDSMANDLALAKQMGDSVLTAVQNFYDTYGEATYNSGSLWQQTMTKQTSLIIRKSCHGRDNLCV